MQGLRCSKTLGTVKQTLSLVTDANRQIDHRYHVIDKAFAGNTSNRSKPFKTVRIASDLLAMQEAMMVGERPAQAALRLDFEERNELLGLFDEFVRIQWGIADPGPGKDRSGLQAIPLMVGGAVDRRLGKLIAVWNQ